MRHDGSGQVGRLALDLAAVAAGLVAALLGLQPARAQAADTSVYRAEGYTGAGFQEYLTLENSGPAAPVTITYFFNGSPPLRQPLDLPARSRTTVNVNQQAGPGREVAVGVDSGGDPNIFAERPMYFNACLTSLVCASGSDIGQAVAPQSAWSFAEGYTAAGYQEYLSILNPDTATAHLTLTYFFNGAGQTTRLLSVPALTRSTVDVNQQAGAGREVSVRIASDVAVVAERPMYFNACPDGLCVDGGDVAHGIQPATAFQLAEGTTRPGFEEFITLENPGPQPATATVRYMFGPGQGPPVTKMYQLAPASRSTVGVNGDVGPGLDVSADVTSTQLIVAERPLYFSFSPPGFSVATGATDGVGLTPATTWDFAEGYTAPGFQEYITVLNAGPAPASATITYMLGASGTLTQQVSLPPETRTTIDVNGVVGAGHEVSAHLLATAPVVAERPMYFEGCLAGSGVCDRPASYTISTVPYHQQSYELSCEEAALQMALGKEGIAISQTDLLRMIGIDWRAAYRDSRGLRWGDPYANFVGDPNGSEIALTGYGTYLTTIVRVARDAGGSVIDSGVGLSPGALYGHVLDGHPVVAWVSFDWRYHPPGSWLAFDGRWVPSLAPWEHAVTVVGATRGSVLIDNPWSGPQWMSKATFEAAYASLGQMAVVLG
ncbi:MAG: C39 family peptidase [Candidatus Dormibacteraceae bacterium]